MIRTIIFFSVIWLTLLLSILLFLPFPLFLLPGFKKYKGRYVHFWASWWTGMVIRLTGSKITITGQGHIPATTPFVIISNHQGFMDIPILIQVFPFFISFVAKKELLKVPLINLWLLAQECVTIDRKKPLVSYKKIAARLKKGEGNPIILFPEGTRSKGPVQGKWKKGGMKLVEGSGIPMVFVNIDGSYKILEETGRIRPAEVKVTISPELIN